MFKSIKKEYVSYVLVLCFGLFMSAMAVSASTTISTNINTGGTLTVTGVSTLTGLTSMGQASSTMLSAHSAYFGATATSSFTSAGVLTLTNGETISNATDGVIQLFGIASTTSLTLLN
ncbi:MAG: hypothetical protein Q7T74_00180 [Candidatus Saccharibacteria bacterium]|nr:hypothetical protein [Candidatus Saccharibacteria bacterium]